MKASKVDRTRGQLDLLGALSKVPTYEDEVRERICEELRPGVVAQWSDPREQLGIRPRMAKASGRVMTRRREA